jgi:hypothetical protein
MDETNITEIEEVQPVKTTEPAEPDVRSVQERISEYEAVLEKLKAELPKDEKPEVSFDIIRDPYDQHDPYFIKAFIPPDDDFPKGQALSWKNEAYRSGGRWRGWTLMTYDDPYYKFLEDCIPDPPKKIEGSTKMDNYIRRQDLILCRLDKRLFDARQYKRIKKSDEARRISSREVVETPTGISVWGPGCEKDSGGGSWLYSRHADAREAKT